MKTIKERALAALKLKTLEKDLCAKNAGWAESFFNEVLPGHEDPATVFAAECSFYAGVRLAVEAMTEGAITPSFYKLYRDLFDEAKEDWEELSAE